MYGGGAAPGAAGADPAGGVALPAGGAGLGVKGCAAAGAPRKVARKNSEIPKWGKVRAQAGPKDRAE